MEGGTRSRNLRRFSTYSIVMSVRALSKSVPGTVSPHAVICEGMEGGRA
jgi:hypothetical protein